jgi:hypothetical protein
MSTMRLFLPPPPGWESAEEGGGAEIKDEGQTAGVHVSSASYAVGGGEGAHREEAVGESAEVLGSGSHVAAPVGDEEDLAVCSAGHGGDATMADEVSCEGLPEEVARGGGGADEVAHVAEGPRVMEAGLKKDETVRQCAVPSLQEHAQEAQEEHVQQQGQKHEQQKELLDQVATHVPQGVEPGLFSYMIGLFSLNDGSLFLITSDYAPRSANTRGEWRATCRHSCGRAFQG